MLAKFSKAGYRTIILKYNFIFSLLLGMALVGSAVKARAADDDWEAVSDTAAVSAPVAAPSQAANRARAAQPEGATVAPGKSFKICGEAATEASPQVASMVERINGVWGSDFHAYQTVALEQPHASRGGCVFYNTAAMASIMAYRLGVNDTEVVDPLTWAIFAHEIGHQVHHDTEASREAVPNATRELEADRFAGYTLEKLKIRATDLSPYWNLTGDDFGGRVPEHYQHGSSEQRLAAFKQGWNLAEWKRPEGSVAVADAVNESVAPDAADGSPK